MMKMEECAAYLKSNQSRILKLWESRASREVEAASKVPMLVLRNHIPEFLESIINILEAYEEGSDEKEIFANEFDVSFSEDHGRIRASTAHYTLKQVVEEYLILRQVLRDTLKERKLLSLASLEIIDRSIESSSSAAGQVFVDSIQKMQEKLIGTVAHDLRNPISIALTYTEAAKDNLISRSESDEVVKNNLKRAIGFITELLDATQVRAGQGMTFRFEDCDILSGIATTCAEAKNLYHNEIIFTCTLKSIKGVFDQMAIRRTIENLLSNAVKYGGSRTPVTVVLEEDTKDKVRISVHNEGSYIKKDKLLSVFNFQARGCDSESRYATGWGLGLYLVKIVTKAHNGEVWVDSSEKGGTTFFVKLDKYSHPSGASYTQFL